MSEFMGNITGSYDAEQKGFEPGAASLHSTMAGHGPEKEVFEKASNEELHPLKTDSMSFMWETAY
jgi:homogentisate 1,2-dioxygenase